MDNFESIPDPVMDSIITFVLGMQNKTDDYSHPILKPIVSKIYPLFIIQYGLLAIFGIVSNSAIIVYIIRYKLYRDVTQAFIVNLAFCHFVQCAIELPITLMVLLIQNWIFGQFWCFFLPLLQDIPLHVAMISHLLIAWDRMRWLGDPLKTRIPAFVCSCATWLTGMVIALPYPIYTTFLDLGIYMKQFRGVGICMVNLVDDMQEYTRGLFVIMYCAPIVLLAYLYIRTSRELRPPDGPTGVMMYEAREDARNRQRTSSSSSSRPGRTQSTRSYDLYDAELDVTREKRTQRHLGAMAATQVICVCPLMVMKLARMALYETYDNTAHFDITYLMFVWVAFLPTGIVPWIYAAWILSRPAKDRLRGYFRLSSRRTEKQKAKQKEHHTNNNADKQQKSDDNLITDKITTKPFKSSGSLGSGGEEDGKKKIPKSKKGNPYYVNTERRGDSGVNEREVRAAKTELNTISEMKNKLKAKKTEYEVTMSAKAHDKIIKSFFQKTDSIDPLTNSCSNITSSTYCNNGTDRDLDTDNASSIFTDHDSIYEKKPLCEKSADNNYFRPKPSLKNSFYKNHDNAGSIADSDFSSRKGSTSTLSRDLEIIDLLERERSMDIQEMIAKERRAEMIASATVSRQGSTVERRRKLPEPDYSKISANINSKLLNLKDARVCSSTTRYSPTIRDCGPLEETHVIAHQQQLQHQLSRKNSRNSYVVNRDSFTGPPHDLETPVMDPRIIEHRFNRQRSSNSSRGSAASRRYSGNEFRESGFSDDL